MTVSDDELAALGIFHDFSGIADASEAFRGGHCCFLAQTPLNELAVDTQINK
jgi:hypothetical protein